MSVSFSIFDTARWLILRTSAILATDIAEIRRSSLSVDAGTHPEAAVYTPASSPRTIPPNSTKSRATAAAPSAIAGVP